MKKLVMTMTAGALALMMTACAGIPSESSAEKDEGIYGVVGSISGNELSLELGELKVEQGGSIDMGGMQAASSVGGSKLPEGGDAPQLQGSVQMSGGDIETFDLTGSANVGGGKQVGEGGAKTQSSVEMSGTPFSVSFGSLSIERSGETGVYTLPVNVKVTLEIGSESVNVDFSQIENGDVLRIIMVNDTVTEIAIMGKEASAD